MSCPETCSYSFGRIPMVYFFSKHGRFVQCEIHPGRPHVLVMIGPGDQQQCTEQYATSGELTLRWEHVLGHMERNGWSGPFGRDPRS
jgi:hypothetical protein